MKLTAEATDLVHVAHQFASILAILRVLKHKQQSTTSDDMITHTAKPPT